MSERDFVRAAFLTVLSVEPTDLELSVVLESIVKWNAAARSKNRPNVEALARVSVIHALLNHNDFVTVR